MTDKMTHFFILADVNRDYCEDGYAYKQVVMPFDTPDSTLMDILIEENMDYWVDRDAHVCEEVDSGGIDSWCDWCKDHADTSGSITVCEDDSECESERERRIEHIKDEVIYDWNVYRLAGYDHRGEPKEFWGGGSKWEFIPRPKGSTTTNMKGVPTWDE